MEDDGMWSDDPDRLIERLELRLEQYRIHAQALRRGSRDHEGANMVVRRLESRLVGLRAWKEKGTPASTITAPAARMLAGHRQRGRVTRGDT